MRPIRSTLFLAALCFSLLIVPACKKKETKTPPVMKKSALKEKIEAYAPIRITADLSRLSPKEKDALEKLVEAGKIADEIFWKESSPDAIAYRDQFRYAATDEKKEIFTYIMINYGPYDRIYGGKRFVGQGPAEKPPTANFYPPDMKKEEFETYVREHPDQKDSLESQYTIVVREGKELKAVPYHVAFKEETEKMAELLGEAAALIDNKSLKKYLTLRAQALLTDDYYASDMAWLDVKNNNLDIVIGPIENYEDALFNYKTAHECAVVVKDEEGTKELQMFKAHLDGLEKALPEDPKYIRPSAGKGNVLEVVNVVYFGGDFQKGVKTIAASLPNDPRVTQAKGGKKQMYRNLMEAKFAAMVAPIAKEIVADAQQEYIDKHSFTSFVTLHEVSHTLGRGFVFGDDALPVRRALKERYSAIEECKADVLGIYNGKYFLDKGIYTDETLKKNMVTYLAGLFRSLRFGAEEAHGRANLIQFNFLREKGAIDLLPNGKYRVNFEKFMPAAAELGKELLDLEAEGNYERAGALLDKYGVMNPEIDHAIEKLKSIPRDLNTSYQF